MNDNNTLAQHDISFSDLFKLYWRTRIFIVLFSLLSSIFAVIFSLSLPNIYQSSALLSPVDSSNNGVSSLVSQYGGLASLAGVNLGSLGSSDGDRTLEALAVLESRRFLTNFIKKRNIEKELLASDYWDSDNLQLYYNNDVYDEEKQIWISDKKGFPTDRDLYLAFHELLSIKRMKDLEGGFVTVGFEHKSPIFAEKVTSQLIEDLNNEFKEKDIEQASLSINYLTEQLEQTSLIEVRKVMFNLIEQETKKIMIAKATNEYIFRYLDPPIAPERKLKPNRPFIVILSGVIGGLLSIIVVTFLFAFESSFLRLIERKED
tara:strand:+ start:1012 stop:1965 length:954 start_codon:yes stop_codon:yes gene_type:complete